MESLLVIMGIIGLGVFGLFYEKQKIKRTPFYKLKKKLEDDLLIANFESNWRRRQEINLQLLWLEALYEDEKEDSFGADKEKSEYDILKKISVEDLKFPKQKDEEYFSHVRFAHKITQSYGNIWANDFKHKVRLYKPEGALLLPKEAISDWMRFYLTCKELPKGMEEPMQGLLPLLDDFIPFDVTEVPIEHKENREFGRKWEEENSINKFKNN